MKCSHHQIAPEHNHAQLLPQQILQLWCYGLWKNRYSDKNSDKTFLSIINKISNSSKINTFPPKSKCSAFLQVFNGNITLSESRNKIKASLFNFFPDTGDSWVELVSCQNQSWASRQCNQALHLYGLYGHNGKGERRGHWLTNLREKERATEKPAVGEE